jgi:hypothetical protein
MIKARKGFIPALFALLTIFVLVPSMAFAQTGSDDIASWGAKYATVTDTDGHTFQTERTFTSDGFVGMGHGIIIADPQNDESTIPTTIAPTSDGYFFDLDGSAFTYNGNPLDGKTIEQSSFNSVLNHLYVTLTEPEYAKDYDAKAPKTASFKVGSFNSDGVATVSLTNWNIQVEMSEYEAGSTKDQTVTFSVKAIDAVHEVVPTNPSTPDLDGTIAEATVTVKGQPITPANAKFYFDSTDALFGGSDGVIGVYDGAAHQVVCDLVEGYDVSYEIYNKKTGKWSEALAVSVTDVDEALRARAVFTDTKTKAVTKKEFRAQIVPGLGAKIGFNKEESLADEGYVYEVPGAEYNTADYIASEAVQVKYKNSDDEYVKDIARYVNECSKKAYEANKETIDAWFNDFYEVTTKVTKAHPNTVTMQIAAKDLTKEDAKALHEKYEQFEKNFGDALMTPVTEAITVDTTSKATLNINAAVVVDTQVEFVNTPTAVTYKAKALKKKAKSFTVTAVANNGATVNYKLINAPKKITINKTTGKITLKKGLKKGKYKVKVKAYVPGAPDYAGLYETQNITIKVKK